MGIPFAVPSITSKEKAAVMEVLDNGWLTSGKKMLEFENRLQDMVNANVVCLNSATAGLHLVLLSLGLEAQDEVIVPTVTFAATAEVVKAVGATVRLCDVCPQTQNLRIADLEAQYHPGLTKAVMLVHMAGLPPAKYDEIMLWCGERRLEVIEDAAHTFGARYADGTPVGGSSRSYATVFSFYATKCITTGEGGAVCTQDGDLATKLRQLRLHGISRDVFDRYTANVPKWEYDVVLPGWKYNMTDMAAAIGLVQLERNAEMLEARTEIARQYQLNLTSRIQMPAFAEGHAHHLFVVRVPHSRNEFIEALFEKGIGCSVHFKPLHQMTAYKEEGMLSDYPNADRYFRECVSLPIWADMSEEQVAEVIEAVNTVAQEMYA